MKQHIEKKRKYVTKIGSNSYRIRKKINGVEHSRVLDHDPKKAEVEKVIAEFYNDPRNGIRNGDLFERAYEVYITERPKNTSPATITGYEKIYRSIPEYFKKMKLDEITDYDIQKLVNDFSYDHSVKSTKNYYGLIHAVINFYYPEKVLKVKLPKQENKKREEEDYIPSDEDIQRILLRAKGTYYEIPLTLAAYGLRRSEIIALAIDDLVQDEYGYSIDIRKAVVQNKEKQWVEKQMNKAPASTRRVHISDYLADLILQQEFMWKGNPDTARKVYKKHPENIRKTLVLYQDELGIPHFSLHKMRHYFASSTHAMGLCDAEIMAAGGWETDHVMKAVYRHANKAKVSDGQKQWADKLEKMQQQNCPQSGIKVAQL